MSETKRHRTSKFSYLLMLGHLWADTCQGAMAATLPFLIMNSGYSYTDVTILIFAQNIASAIIQPLFGWLGDKKSRPWLMGLGVIFAGTGITGVGLLGSFPLIVCSAMVTGLGVAMFHPEGGRLANLVAGEDKAHGMSIFAVGGNVGFIIGPMIAAALLSLFGLPGTAFFLIPAIAIAAVLLAFTRYFKSFGLSDAKAVEAAGGKERWGAFGLIMGALSVNSVLGMTLSAFIPMFIITMFSQTQAFGSAMLSVLSICGAVGTVLSGRISQKVGTQRLMIIAFIFVGIALPLIALAPNLILCIVLAAACPLVSNSFYPASVALGQGFVPQHLGMASGLTYGISISVGGMFSPVFGMIGDNVGLQPVFFTAACFALAGLLFSIAVWRVSKPRA